MSDALTMIWRLRAITTPTRRRRTWTRGGRGAWATRFTRWSLPFDRFMREGSWSNQGNRWSFSCTRWVWWYRNTDFFRLLQHSRSEYFSTTHLSNLFKLTWISVEHILEMIYTRRSNAQCADTSDIASSSARALAVSGRSASDLAYLRNDGRVVKAGAVM